MRVSNQNLVFDYRLKWYLCSCLSLLQILLPTLFTHLFLNVFNLFILPLCTACRFLIRINQNEENKKKEMLDLKDNEFRLKKGQYLLCTA